jgi:hypothetical protein
MVGNCVRQNSGEKMITFITRSVLGIGLLLAGATASPQEKANAPKEETKPATSSRSDATQLKVQITFTEFDGEKKIKSLPYSLLIQPGEGPGSKIRMGSRVPIYSGGEHGEMQYIDVGTNIDCRANSQPDGRYRLGLMLERSWVEGDVFVPVRNVARSSTDPAIGQFAQPIIRQFRSDSYVTVREGQTLETNFATDPVSGKVIKMEVSISVVK